MKGGDDWEGLAEIAAMIRDREMGRVEAIVRHMDRIRADIAQIEDAGRAGRTGEIDVARLTGADLAWAAWSQERLTRLQAQLATLRASHEAALSGARRAFGRADVTRRIAKGER